MMIRIENAFIFFILNYELLSTRVLPSEGVAQKMFNNIADFYFNC